MSPTKELFITAAQLLPLDGDRVIPTVVYYSDNKPVVGNAAFDQADLPENLQDNFKIALGTRPPASLATKQLRVGLGPVRSPLGIANDFFATVLSRIKETLVQLDEPFPKRILIAEPLSLGGDQRMSDSWLSNYRRSLRSILSGRFSEIDFLPEPFAVFQYYRYGIRHPLIAQRQKHIALVVDFGGGTFDVSILETTSEGDISMGGRNSRPLSASSIPVGGFYVNKIIADTLLFEVVDKKANKKSIREAINAYFRIKDAADFELSVGENVNREFFSSYGRLLRNVENAKIAICSNIANWQLSSNYDNLSPVLVAVPSNPFSAKPSFVEVRLDAARLRDLFENQVWKQRLLPAIRNGLQRAYQELAGKSTSVVLLSGGSANIGWLRQLMLRDINQDIGDAEILDLAENFQEIVSKGLAVECARRYFTAGEGDFRAVTYNRLCLVLNPNDKGAEITNLRPLAPELERAGGEPGVLLPSASSVRGLIDKPLRWRTKLSVRPSQRIQYYFMRSSFDPNDLENLHNVTESSIDTPKGTKFGSSIELELVVRDDGTAFPKFIYGKSGSRGREEVVEGRPFYLDMTFAPEEVAGDTYLGFDFGTSTSTLSIVRNRDVQEYVKRSKDSAWLELNELANALPYPAAYPLARYMSETSEEGMERWGRETFEAMLGVAAYICYGESRIYGSKDRSRLFGGLTHRSAGPLWNLFKRSVEKMGGRGWTSAYFDTLVEGSSREELDHAVSGLAQAKHGKMAQGLDYPRVIGLMGNALAKVFEENCMGYFESIQPAPFALGKFKGVFRSLQGASEPFVNLFEYEGREALPINFVFLASPERGKAICLYPLFINGLGRLANGGGPELYLFDVRRRNGTVFGYRGVRPDLEVAVEAEGEFSEVHRQLAQMSEVDGRDKLLEALSLVRRSSDQ